MKRANRTLHIALTLGLALIVTLGALLVTAVPALAQGPDIAPPAEILPVEDPGVPLPEGAPGAGETQPNFGPTDGGCHIGNPNCDLAASFGIDPVPNLVRIWQGRPFGAAYRAGERIYITMSHSRGGYVYLYDWQPYMGQRARLIGAYWLPAGYPRTIVARVVPPYGPEWLTVYDPYNTAYDRTHFQVVP